MKTISPAFAAYLGQPYQKLCTCWMVTQQGGSVFTFTDHNENLSLPLAYFPTQGDRTYLAAVGYRPSNIQTSSDLDVDNMEVQGVLFDSSTITEDSLFAGRWDYATVSIFIVNWSDFTMGPIPLMKGHIGKVTLELGVFRAELRSLMQAYTRSIGELRTPGCRATLGDSRCKVRLGADTWAGLHAYTTFANFDAGIGDIVQPTVPNGYYYACGTAGTSGAIEPVFNTIIGAPTVDGSVVWTTRYALRTPSVVGGVNPDNRTIYDATLAFPGPTGGVTITNVTNANPCVVTLSAPVPVVTGEAITLSGLFSMAVLNTVTIAHNVSGNTFELDLDTTNTLIYGTYTGGQGIATPLGDSGFFDGGILTFTSGDNIGIPMEVKTYVPGQITCVLPFPYTILTGDTFTISAGCSKQIETCKTKFNNIYNMRAEPWLTGQDRLMQVGSRQT